MAVQHHMIILKSVEYLWSIMKQWYTLYAPHNICVEVSNFDNILRNRFGMQNSSAFSKTSYKCIIKELGTARTKHSYCHFTDLWYKRKHLRSIYIHDAW